MMRLLAMILALSAVLTLAGCSRTYDWHQDIRLLIETPRGLVEASAVQSVEIEYYPEWLRINGFALERNLRGEAVVADLGEGRYLFALLGGAGLAEGVYRDLGDWPGIFRRIERQVDKPARDIPKRLWPQMVTLEDATDPKSVRMVDPNNLSASFGEGYALRKVTLAVTEAPVTAGVVEGVLGWLAEHGETHANLKGTPKSGLISEQPDPLVYMIAPSHFSTELYR
jgi:hypothetical protein